MILDTNALSAAAEREPSALAVVANAQRLALPVIVLGEFRLGIAASRYKATYEAWLNDWVGAVEVLDIDNETTHSYAAIGLELKSKGKPIPSMIYGSLPYVANTLFRSSAETGTSIPSLDSNASTGNHLSGPQSG